MNTELTRKDETLVPIKEAATALGVTDRTLRRWITDDGIPVFTVGNRLHKYLSREDFDRLMAPRPAKMRGS